MSGLQAAQAVQAATRSDPAFKTAPNRRELLRKIEILEPETYPSVNFKAVKLALVPYAAGAKVWSRLEQMSQSPSGNLSSRDLRPSVWNYLLYREPMPQTGGILRSMPPNDDRSYDPRRLEVYFSGE